MAKINLDTRKQVQRVGVRAAPSADYGMAPLKAQEAMGNTLQQVSSQVGAMATDYAAKNKASDMKADELKYEATKRRIFQDAENQASLVTDPDKVNEIYTEAQNQLDVYATTKDTETGIPNVRWKDQQTGIRGDAQNMRVVMEGAKAGRKMEISKANTVAIYKGNMVDAMKDGNYSAMRENTNMMVSNGYYTQDEANLAYTEAATKSEEMAVKHLSSMIDTMPAEQAVSAANVAATKIDDMGFLTGDERALAKREIKTKAKDRLDRMEYNNMNAQISSLRNRQNAGEITLEQEMDALREMQGEIETVDPKYRSLAESRIYAGLDRGYNTNRREMATSFNGIISGLDKSNTTEAEFEHFLRDRIDDYADMTVMAKSARTAMGKTTAPNAKSVIQAVDYALAGEKDGEPYTISDAVKDMKDARSKLTPVGMLILGAAMSAPDSGVDNEELDKTWVTKTHKGGWGTNTTAVDPDSLMAATVRYMGAFMADDEADAKWVQKTFVAASKIHANEDYTYEEKVEKTKSLFADKARLFAEATPAPQLAPVQAQQNTQKQAAEEWLKNNPDDPRAEAVRKKLESM